MEGDKSSQGEDAEEWSNQKTDREMVEETVRDGGWGTPKYCML